jgi:spore coat polysaccharide biosynthesis predicted glycosyltransferase SpsG
MQKALLVCHVSHKAGLGHLSRLTSLAKTLKKENQIIPEILIFGNLIKKKDLNSFKIHNISSDRNLINSIKDITKNNDFSVLIFDLYTKKKIKGFTKLLQYLKKKNFFLINIGSLLDNCDNLDLVWIPSFYFDNNKNYKCKNLINYGWDKYLIEKRLKNKKWLPGNKVLVLTGGSDVYNLGKTFPNQLDKNLEKNIEISWVKGPLANNPILPKKCRLNWTIHDSPTELDRLIVDSNYVITLFGISFFEVIQYGIPTIVIHTHNKKDNIELEFLSKENVASVAKNTTEAIDNLISLMNNLKLAKKYSMNSLKKLSSSGVKNLSKQIYSLVKNRN